MIVIAKLPKKAYLKGPRSPTSQKDPTTYSKNIFPEIFHLRTVQTDPSMMLQK